MEAIRRILHDEIEKRIRRQKVMLVFGARRVGKTVLLKQIVENYKGKTLLVNGESMDTVRMLADRSANNYRQLFSGIDLLAIDEAQHIPEIGLKLKLLVDELPDIAVIATGSSSFDLQNQAGEPLVGRSTTFMLTPLSAEELMDSKRLSNSRHKPTTELSTAFTRNCKALNPKQKKENTSPTLLTLTCCATYSQSTA